MPTRWHRWNNGCCNGLSVSAFFYAAALAALIGLIAYRNHLLDEGFTFIYDDEPEPTVRTPDLSQWS